MLAQEFEYLDALGLFATATARLKLQHLQTMRLIMQHKPIERSTDMVILMTKKSQIQAWLNCLYTEKRYGQHTVSKHVHAGRHPGVPAPVMIQRTTTLHHPFGQRTIRRSRHSVSQSKSDLVAHNSGSCGSVCFLCSCYCFQVKIKDLWIGDSSAIQIAVTSRTHLQTRSL